MVEILSQLCMHYINLHTDRQNAWLFVFRCVCFMTHSLRTNQFFWSSFFRTWFSSLTVLTCSSRIAPWPLHVNISSSKVLWGCTRHRVSVACCSAFPPCFRISSPTKRLEHGWSLTLKPVCSCAFHLWVWWLQCFCVRRIHSWYVSAESGTFIGQISSLL